MKDAKSGFSLLEVLAAIVLTSLLAVIFDQAFAIARHSNQIPRELFVAVAKARIALARAKLSAAAKTASTHSPFRVNVDLSKVHITETSRTIPPPIPSRDTPPNSPAAPHLQLREVTVIVTAPSGRRTELNGVASLAQPN